MPTAANSVAREWITIQQAADHLDLTERSVRAMIADGRLRGYRNGRRVIRLDLNEVDAAMKPFGGAV
ncbi:excisionase family DNA-binding protein [Mycobacterium sp. Lab-001]|uniref:excisionase family DNA-binding protein n=1 Tax=Mycobacterium sp. Lab-001 TaxID=3410136 RepID=UPI003D17A315